MGMTPDFTHTRGVVAENPHIAYAELQVWKRYSDVVSVAERAGSLIKGGYTDAVTTTARTVATLGSGISHETYQTSNTIDTVTSEDTGDTVDLTVEGHTVDGNGNFTYVEQSVTLLGQNKATLGTPLARVLRAYNTGATDLTGPVYVFRDTTVSAGVPQTAANVHLVIDGGKNASQKGATTISQSDYYFITEIYASVNNNVAAEVDVELEVRTKGSVFREFFPLSVTTSGTNTVTQAFTPYLIIPKNADVRMTAVSVQGSGIVVAAGFDGYLASIVG